MRESFIGKNVSKSDIYPAFFQAADIAQYFSSFLIKLLFGRDKIN